jgi:hypothetical protein
MKVMPSVLGQVGQNVADNLFEIGQSAVKGTASAVADIASDSIEQVVSAPGAAVTTQVSENTGAVENKVDINEQRKVAERQRFEEVKGELATYIQRKKELDRKIAEEKAAESRQANQNDFVEKKKRDNWVSKLINRSQTNTERGRMAE